MITKFWNAFEDWEAQAAIDAIKRVGVSQESSKSLGDVPPAILYHLLSKANSFTFTFVLDIIAIRQFELPSNVSSWPTTPPAGVLLLALHESSEIRGWVNKHWDLSSEMDAAAMVGQHKYAIRLILERLSRTQSTITFPFLQSDIEIWSNMESIISCLPPSLIASTGIPKTIVSHLRGPEKRTFFYFASSCHDVLMYFRL